MSSTVAAHIRNNRRDVTARRRGLSMAEKAALVALGAVLVAVTLGAGSTQVPNVPTHTVRVESGDTLWHLAERHPVEGLTTEQTVELIVRTNQLTDAGVQAGAEIAVPAQPGTTTTALR